MENLPGGDVGQVDKAIFEAHNSVRKNPTSMIADLENMLDKFDGFLLKRGGQVTLRTKEGVEAVTEAITCLKQQTPVAPLKWNSQVAKAAADHRNDIGPRGLIQHDSSDNKTGVKERLRNYGNVVSCYGENLSFHCEMAKEVML